MRPTEWCVAPRLRDEVNARDRMHARSSRMTAPQKRLGAPPRPSTTISSESPLNFSRVTMVTLSDEARTLVARKRTIVAERVEKLKRQSDAWSAQHGRTR